MTPIPIHAAMKAQSDRRPPDGPSPSGGSVLARTDARWILAARASLAATGAAQIHPRSRDRLADWANEQGIAPIHAASIIDIAEQAARRGGLDASDADRIARLPAPSPRSAAFTRDRTAMVIAAAIPALIAIVIVLAFARS
jgi:hypothetical protein